MDNRGIRSEYADRRISAMHVNAMPALWMPYSSVCIHRSYLILFYNRTMEERCIPWIWYDACEMPIDHH